MIKYCRGLQGQARRMFFKAQRLERYRILLNVKENESNGGPRTVTHSVLKWHLQKNCKAPKSNIIPKDGTVITLMLHF